MTAPPDTGLIEPSDVRVLIAQMYGVQPDVVRVERLVGGVSAVVFRAETPTGTVVVKQALPVLDVPWHWEADPGRSNYEAQALAIYGQLTPFRVPRVYECLDDRHLIVMEAAPLEWRNFKSELLTGGALPIVSGTIGQTLGEWHSRTFSAPEIAARFDRAGDLQDLRIAPYFEASAENQPALAELMAEAAAILRRPGRCLVHGDATPKNVLASRDGAQVWLLDPEVAHFGQPEFDIALWISHLLLKIHRRSGAPAVAGASLCAFINGYQTSGPMDAITEDEVGLLVIAIVQARLNGLSRIDYVDQIDTDELDRTLTRITRERIRSLNVLTTIGSELV